MQHDGMTYILVFKPDIWRALFFLYIHSNIANRQSPVINIFDSKLKLKMHLNNIRVISLCSTRKRKF